MIQNVDEVFSLFFDKVEQDADFFNYYGISDEEAMKLAKERARSYMRSAMVYFSQQTELGFDLSIHTVDDEELFVEEITNAEADIISEIMLLRYFERGLAKLSPKINVLSASDLKVLHSPANERTSYLELIAHVKENLVNMISHYAATDRLTGKRKMVDHTVPQSMEE